MAKTIFRVQKHSK